MNQIDTPYPAQPHCSEGSLSFNKWQSDGEWCVSVITIRSAGRADCVVGAKAAGVSPTKTIERLHAETLGLDHSLPGVATSRPGVNSRLRNYLDFFIKI